MAAPTAVFRENSLSDAFPRCDVYDAQTTTRNSTHQDIRRIRVPLHAELRCSWLIWFFSGLRARFGFTRDQPKQGASVLMIVTL